MIKRIKTKRIKPRRKHKKTRSKRIHGGEEDKIKEIMDEIDKEQPNEETILKLISELNPEEQSKLGIQNEKGDTLLMKVCVNKMNKVALKLIDNYDSNPLAIKKYGYTALNYAIMNKMEDVALKLIEKTKGSNDKTIIDNFVKIEYDKSNLLIDVCYKRMNKIAVALIETGKFDLLHKNIVGNTALIEACSHGIELEDVALTLIEKMNPKELGIQNGENYTALMKACKDQELEKVAMVLIKQMNPPDLGLVNKEQNTALIFACENEMEKVALALIEKINNLDDSKKILNTINTYGSNALIYACKNNLIDVALEIIKTGKIDMTAQNSQKKSVFSILCMNKNLRKVLDDSIIKELGCPDIIDVKDSTKFTPQIIFIPNPTPDIIHHEGWEKKERNGENMNYLNNLKNKNVIREKCANEFTILDLTDLFESTNIVIIQNNDEIMGFCLFHKETDHIYIDRLCATNTYYKNVGTFILDEIVKMTQKNGMTKVKLQSLPKAISFYQKYGFIPDDGKFVFNITDKNSKTMK